MGLLLVACDGAEAVRSGATPQADAETLALGQQVYETTCTACHGINGEGQNPQAPLRRDATGRFPAPPHNENGHTWHHDDDLLFQIVKEGGMGDPDNFYPMPAFGDQLTDGQIEAVLAYIKTMWTDEQRQRQAEVTALVRSRE